MRARVHSFGDPGGSLRRKSQLESMCCTTGTTCVPISLLTTKTTIMKTFKITLEFDIEETTNKEMITIPFDARVHFMRDSRNKIYFAYEIRGHLYRPQISDIILFQKLYDCKSYKCLSEYLKGETLVLIKSHF